MKAMIEGLENRLVFAATGVDAGVLTAPADAVATAVHVEVDRSALDTARAQLKRATIAGAENIRSIITSGKQALAADRELIQSTNGDPVAQAAARDQLKATRARIRADLRAARESLKANTAEARATFKDAVASLKVNLKQLRVDVKDASAAERQSLRDAVHAVVAKSDVSHEQVQSLIDKVKDILNGADPIDPAVLRTLSQTVSAALDDGALSAEERQQITTDAKAVLSDANITEEDLSAIATEVRGIIEASNLSLNDLADIAQDVRALFDAVLLAQ